MDKDLHSIEAKGINVTLDLRVGHIRDFVVERDGRVVHLLHTAPWIGEESTQRDESIPLSLRRLSGDFFCAPFSTSDIEPGPNHGATANQRWHHAGTERADGEVTARYELSSEVMGARVEKTFTLRDDHPFLYETHTFTGGRGAVPIANHAMVQFPTTGSLSFSPKLRAVLPQTAPEPDPRLGRSILSYPAESSDIRHIPSVNGEVDLSRFPIGDRHEDIVLLVEDPKNPLGWAAALQHEKNALFLSLKDPREFPVTVLWYSNGGRFYPPWSSRHVGVMGIEEARSYLLYGHRASIEPNPLSSSGTPTALALAPDGKVSVHNVIGGIPVPADGLSVSQISAADGGLSIRLGKGEDLRVLFDAAFLGR
jgi:hypothetical protein